ncbi:MAG: hypothetical protein HDT39_11470 [Lachnospiraceae bacterium]|nr:hypothetical protein [Lachnospiraceae bacterium]
MKRVINKIIILSLVFIAAMVLLFFKSNNEIENEPVTMGKATLPIMSIKQGESYINTLRGYTMSMEAKYMRDSITPVSSDRKVNITINNCENMIIGAEYEVMSMNAEKVYQKSEIKDFNSSPDTTEMQVLLDNTIASDEEYLLVIKVNTDRYDNIYYYTRVSIITEPHFAEQDKFVRYFSEATFDKTKAEELVSYIEPNATEENSNLGRVTIYSSFNQLTWGNLSPERVTQPEITYKELLGDVGSYELNYRVKALNSYGTEQYYNVTEFFRVKWTSTDIYLLDYERIMEQIFDAMGQSITSSRINLGIDSELNTDYAADETGTYVAFVKEQSLWLMDTKLNQVTSIFSYSSVTNDSDMRNTNKEHEMKIVSLNKNGNMEFMVYGYMNRGEHEGDVGIALYKYTKETNLVEESVFIPFTRSFQILKETIGKLMYVNDAGVMYIMLNDCIYSIDLTGNEYVQIISNLKDGCYAINDDSTVVAWEKDMSYAGSDSIVVMNLKTNQEFTINADAGMKIKISGFLGEDVVYGIAETGRIVTDQNGITTVPMHIIKIVNMDGEEQKAFSQEGYYFTSSQVKENMINLKRVQYDVSGTVFQNVSDYQIFGNEEEDEDTAVMTTINTDLKQKELVINFTKKVTTSDKLDVKYPKEIKFDDTNTLSLRELISSKERYYVYGKGRVPAIYDNAADAVLKANEVNGVVVDDNIEYVWARRSRSKEKTLTNVSLTPSGDVAGYVSACVNGMLKSCGIEANAAEELAQGRSTIDVMNSHMNNQRAIDLAGCSLDEMLYYVDNGYPVLGMLENVNCVLIVGYDFYNAVLLNPGTGQTYRQGLEETAAQFEQYGNRFAAIYSVKK